jgi:hypothetical protein
MIVDAGVIHLLASPTEFYKGQSTNVTCTVTNGGNSTHGFVLNIYYNSTLLATVNITSVAPSTNATITVTWNATAVPSGKHVLSPQIPPFPYETHISDNNLTDGMVTMKISGDITETVLLTSKTHCLRLQRSAPAQSSKLEPSG